MKRTRSGNRNPDTGTGREIGNNTEAARRVFARLRNDDGAYGVRALTFENRLVRGYLYTRRDNCSIAYSIARRIFEFTDRYVLVKTKGKHKTTGTKNCSNRI